MKRYFKIIETTENEYEENTGFVSDGMWCQSVDPVDGAIYVATDTEEDGIEIDMETLVYAFGEAEKYDND